MKNAIFILIGFLSGATVVFLFTRKMNAQEYFTESESIYGFEETVAQFESIVNDTPDWKVLKTYDLQESMKKSGFSVQAVKVFSLCNPDYSSKILFSNQERVVTSMMPCRLSIYIKTDGKTYISRMNSAEMASKMGGLVDKVMSSASNDMESMIADLIKK
ncbi:MAG: DUF302 domain-containing protein [Prolixibacteraceae bacterium]